MRRLFWWAWLIAALVPLSFVFSGPFDSVESIDGPGFTLPPGGEHRLDGAPLPQWWQRLYLRVRCERGQDCAALAVRTRLQSTAQRPTRSRAQEVFFNLGIDTSQAPEMSLLNTGGQPLTVRSVSLRNYSAVNIRLPRFAVLLNRLPQARRPVLPAFLLAAGSFLLLVLSLKILVERRPQSLSCRVVRWTHLLSPWLLLSVALALWFRGEQLLLSWEVLPLLSLPGFLHVALTGRAVQERRGTSICVALMAVTLTLLAATVLGVGIPFNKFGPLFIYQAHFIRTARGAGLIYLVLAIVLYRREKPWFSPEKHPLLSSALLVFFPSLIVYLANGYSVFGGDTYFNSLLPWRLLQGKGFSYSSVDVENIGTWGLLAIGDKYLPTFPMGPGFLGLPSALLQYALSNKPLAVFSDWNQKFTAAWVAALAAAMLFQTIYLSSRRRSLSLLLTVAFALGTTQLTISSAVLWQHGPAVLLVCLGLFFLVKGEWEDPRWYPLAALPLAFLPLMRLQAVVFYLAGLAAIALLRPAMLIRFLLFSIPGVAATLAVNIGLYHAFLGGYAYQASGNSFATPLLEGVAGSLISPNRGLLIFSPFLILGIAGGGILWARRSRLAITFGVAALIFFFLHAKYYHWHGGACVGPRFSSELVPVLVLFSAAWFQSVKTAAARRIGVALIVLSIGINLPGSFFLQEQFSWNVFPNVDTHRQKRVWDYQDWLPLHFRYRLQLNRFREVPAFPFVVVDHLESLESKAHRYRVKVTLGAKPLEIIRLANLTLKKGAYKILITGELEASTLQSAKLTLEFPGAARKEVTLPVDGHPAFELTHVFRVEVDGPLDILLKTSGAGILIFDTIQLAPSEETTPAR